MLRRCNEGSKQDIANGDRVALRDRQERRWIASETVLALPMGRLWVELI
jgi:hypothetical protein